jgi:hypothetical protein
MRPEELILLRYSCPLHRLRYAAEARAQWECASEAHAYLAFCQSFDIQKVRFRPPSDP